MGRTWSLAQRVTLGVALAVALVWAASGVVLLWSGAEVHHWAVWFVAAVAVTLAVSVLVRRWVRRHLVRPTDELLRLLRMLAAGERALIAHFPEEEFAELAQAIERVQQRIASVQEEVERLAKVRSQFLANVSHELRTPLFAMEGYLETLLDGALEDPRVARSFLEKVHANLQRLSTLLGDLIDIARIESGEMRMSFRYFDVAEVARSVAQQFEERARQSSVQLEVCAPAEQLAYGDRERIGQVLANLVSNAIKYNVPGGRVTICVRRCDGQVEISVSDTGIGIAPEHQSRVFERFYRTDAARSRNVGGSGLGLAIVKHILEAHRAPFELQSQVGQGTTVRFWLKS